MSTYVHPTFPPPEPLFELMWAHWKTGVLRAAVELEIFRFIEDGATTLEALVERSGYSRRGLLALLGSLTALELVAKNQENYSLTPLCDAYLVKGTPSYAGDRCTALASPLLWEAWGEVARAVRTGEPVTREDPLAPDFSHWENLATALVPTAIRAAEAIAGFLGVTEGDARGRDILDIGCGSGVYGFLLAQHDPTATVTAVDWPRVLKVAEGIAEEMGVAERVQLLPGDVLTLDFDENAYDLAIVSNVLHMLGPQEGRTVIGKAHRALRPGGALVINDVMPDSERSTDLFPLLFAVHMLLISPSGNAYTPEEYTHWLETAGFQEIRLAGPTYSGSAVLAVKP